MAHVRYKSKSNKSRNTNLVCYNCIDRRDSCKGLLLGARGRHLGLQDLLQVRDKVLHA